MLKKLCVVCGLLLAATAAVAWQQMDNIPTTTQAGSRITCGTMNGYRYYVWGIFPYANDNRTRYGYCRVDRPDPEWFLDQINPIHHMTYTSATFQWQDDGVFFFSGRVDNQNRLYMLDADGTWYPSYANLPAEPGAGSCIAYVPYGNDPGWVYYLSRSNGGQFYRYPLAPTDNIVVDGICPGMGARIGNRTPLFQWGSTATTQYRLQCSTDSTFGSIVIDVTTSSAQHQDTTALANGTYYWRSAPWIGGAWSWSCARNFLVDADWQTLSNRSDNTHGGVGASMAYIGDCQGHPALLLLVGGQTTQFWQYDLSTYAWSQLASSPSAYPQNEGTSLTTADPTGVVGSTAWASFGGQQAIDDCPWYYVPGSGWYEHRVTKDPPDPVYDSPYPENITFNASMVFGQPAWAYLETGSCGFFRFDPPSDDTIQKWIAEGKMSGGTSAVRTQARVITRNRGFGIEYQLNRTARVRAVLHDAIGRQIGMLNVGEQGPGSYRLSWSADGNGRKLSPGAYFVLLEIGTERAKLKAIVR
jgi:hypothetical protein